MAQRSHFVAGVVSLKMKIICFAPPMYFFFKFGVSFSLAVQT
jgi:hypothetical protein